MDSSDFSQTLSYQVIVMKKKILTAYRSDFKSSFILTPMVYIYTADYSTLKCVHSVHNQNQLFIEKLNVEKR